MRPVPKKTVTLVLGGVRSGKSRYAQELASAFPHVVYIATGQRNDAEMRAKIARHRRERPSTWITVEVSTDLPGALHEHESKADLLLVDCLTHYLGNIMGRNSSVRGKIEAHIERLCDAAASSKTSIVMVSNEVGSGVVPPYKSGRAYRDLLGEMNQRVAGIADRVILMVAGVPLTLKDSRARTRSTARERV